MQNGIQDILCCTTNAKNLTKVLLFLKKTCIPKVLLIRTELIEKIHLNHQTKLKQNKCKISLKASLRSGYIELVSK